jgi:hypothetical protein
MANEKLTVFQRLQKVLSNGSTQKNYLTNNYDIVSTNRDSDIIATASSKDEYERKLLQAKQQALLGKQWIKANYDVTNQSLASLNDVRLMYRDADLMDAFPEIGAALDIYSEEACYVNESTMLNISSKSERVKSVLEDLFVNRLSIHIMLPMICRSMCKYGNTFMLLNIDSKNGILGWKQLPVYEMERWENGQNSPYSSPITNLNTVDENAPQDTKFAWVGQNEYIPYRNWQIAHFRLLYDSIFLPYGCSALNKARRHWRMLSMMEDMMLIYRLDRSIERRVFKINVGAIDEADVQAYVQEIANNFKRKPIIDPMTGQIDLRKSFMNVTEDFFIPTRDDNAASPIETLQGAQNLTAMDDIKFVQNKVCTALRVPKSFLNFEETSGDGKNLSLLDVRFTRTINRVQQSLLMELNKIAIIHLYLNGFQDELNNFTLTMNNPSSQAEMLELENLAKKVTTAKDAVSDPGGGMPLTSLMWAWKHIFKWSDKEIKQNIEELRLETALSAELQKTMQIIKRTGLFDTVDNIYGEPGAEYSEDMGGDENGDMGGGPGGGGMPMGGGLDFGDEGPEAGAEGEMDMDMAAQENGAEPDLGGNDNNADNNSGMGENTPPPNLSETLLRNMNKKIITEKKRVRNDLLKRSKHYADILQERLLKHNIVNDKNNENIDIYDKAFFLNEEMNTLKNQLEKINSDFSSDKE